MAVAPLLIAGFALMFLVPVLSALLFRKAALKLLNNARPFHEGLFDGVRPIADPFKLANRSAYNPSACALLWSLPVVLLGGVVGLGLPLSKDSQGIVFACSIASVLPVVILFNIWEKQGLKDGEK
jgi:hypothetical protein